MLPLQDFKDFVAQNNLFTKDDKILLAVSGGQDSVLMVHLFKLSGFEFGIAHCNFNLRGEESQRDEQFVRMLAAAMDVPFYVKAFQTKAFAESQQLSIQMAARSLRYQWFEEILQQHGYHRISLAQHLDDSIETVLLNLTRGTGISGLHGILPIRDKLIRPMLFLTRPEIEIIVQDNFLAYVEDSSNLKPEYARNRIRLKVVPHLQEINPAFRRTFENNIRRFTETESVVQQYVGQLRQQISLERNQATWLPIEKIQALNPINLLLFELLKPFGFSEHTVANIISSLDSQSGASFYSKSSMLVIDRDYLVITDLSIHKPGIHLIHNNDSCVQLEHDRCLVIKYLDTPFFEKSLHSAFIDASKLIFPLILRSREQGDKFVPLGMKQHKKLSDFLIDEKVPLSEKDQIPVLVNGNGEIIWIAGYRQDDRYKVTGSTNKLAVMTLHVGLTHKNNDVEIQLL